MRMFLKTKLLNGKGCIVAINVIFLIQLQLYWIGLHLCALAAAVYYSVLYIIFDLSFDLQVWGGCNVRQADEIFCFRDHTRTNFSSDEPGGK